MLFFMGKEECLREQNQELRAWSLEPQQTPRQKDLTLNNELATCVCMDSENSVDQ